MAISKDRQADCIARRRVDVDLANIPASAVAVDEIAESAED